MSFNHTSVVSVEESHARILRAQEHLIETTDESAIPPTRVEGVAVTRQLAEFCNQIRAAHRTIKFAAEHRPKSVWVDGKLLVSSMWAYFPGDEYCPLSVGYGDYSVGASENKYCVYSRHIRNEKYGDRREQYHMALADKVDRAVKNFNKYLRPYTPSDVAGMSLDDFQTHLRQASRDASSAVYNLRSSVQQHDAFYSELRALVNTGYTFNNLEFNGLVRDMLAMVDEVNVRRGVHHHGFFVKVREYAGEQLFDVITMMDMGRAVQVKLPPHTTFKSHELEGLDENLPSRLAALSMLDNGAFVEGLGIKVSPTSYWVLK